MNTDEHGLDGEKVGRWERERGSGELVADTSPRPSPQGEGENFEAGVMGGPEDYLGCGVSCGPDSNTTTKERD